MLYVFVLLYFSMLIDKISNKKEKSTATGNDNNNGT